MLLLPKIFSSNALFLQNAPLTLHGLTDAETAVCASIWQNGGQRISSAFCVSDKDGAFSLTLDTPAASTARYTVTVTAADSVHTMENVLFGELWLASGQSNMELENAKQPQNEAFLSALAGKCVRVYHVYNIDGGSAGLFPREPDSMADGAWCTFDDPAALGAVSALGTAFAADLYEYLQTVGEETPVGFVNACWGGTGIHSWLPKTALDADTALAARLSACGLYDDDPLTWNTHGRDNAQQIFCQYNLKIHCLRGMRFRGMLWYQGEFESWDEPYRRTYLDCLYLLRRCYCALFSADGDFPMFCMLIFPFPCTDDGDCYIGYVNQNFVDAAAAFPDEFHIIPTYDLPPVWRLGDHPIHPLHKYALGVRLASLVKAVSYSKNGMKNPAVLRSAEPRGRELYLRFEVPGQPDMLASVGGIRIGTPPLHDGIYRPHGLYLSGPSGVYVPAFCKITAPDTLALFHPGVDCPIQAAYAAGSMEADCAIFAGDYPLAPFLTDYGDREPNPDRTLIRIEGKPWTDVRRTAFWAAKDTAGIFDVFYRPTWSACDGCEIVSDRAFTLGGGSLRIARTQPAGTACTLGAYVDACAYNRLDLENYRSMYLRLLCAGTAALRLILTCRTEDGSVGSVTLAANNVKTLSHGWAEYEIPFDGIPCGEITRMTLTADLSDTCYQFVNLEDIVLMPR